MVHPVATGGRRETEGNEKTFSTETRRGSLCRCLRHDTVVMVMMRHRCRDEETGREFGTGKVLLSQREKSDSA